MLSHLGVVALIVAMIVAGVWQIDRHQTRGDRNDTIRARVAEDAVPLGAVATIDSDADIGEREQFRRVSVQGVYQFNDEVLVRNRTFDGAPGFWVLTPLLQDDGTAAIVNRGWIPLAFGDDSVRAETAPPTGAVHVVGSLQPARKAEGLQQADPATGQLTSLARPDVLRLAQQLDYPVVPLVVRLEATPTAEVAEFPTPLPLPALDAGPHASYAAQWFIFTTIAVVGYPLVLRRVRRGEAGSLPDDLPEPLRNEANDRQGSKAGG